MGSSREDFNPQVGDRVRFRQWEDMAEEFGAYEDGDIPLNNIFFLKEMRGLCGKEFEIESICDGAVYATHDAEWFPDDLCITVDMLEAVEEETEEDCASEELYKFLQTFIQSMEFE